MMRRRFLLVVFMMVAAGCNLNFSASLNVQPNDPTLPPPADTPVPTLTPNPLEIILTLTQIALVPTFQPPIVANPLQTEVVQPADNIITVVITATPVVVPVVVTAPPVVVPVVVTAAPTQAPACTPRTDFKAYHVRWGDTVGYIAKWHGLTVNDIVSANCLTNPDLIFPGQVLYIPPLSGVVSTPVDVAGLPPRSSNGTYQLLVTPNSGTSANGALLLQSGSNVKLQWAQSTTEVPVSISFYYAPTIDGLDPTLIGTSTKEAGWSLTWTVPPDIDAHLSAVAILDDGTPRQPPESVLVSSQP